MDVFSLSGRIQRWHPPSDRHKRTRVCAGLWAIAGSVGAQQEDPGRCVTEADKVGVEARVGIAEETEAIADRLEGGPAR